MSPFGITVEQISTYGASTSLVGVISSIIFARFLDRTKLYKISLILLSLLPVLVMIALIKSLQTEWFLLVLFCGIVFESIVLSAVPLSMAFSTELTYPL
jgi:MFS family permease